MTGDTDEDGVEREVAEIYVVCGEAGEPQRAFTDLEKAKELRDHWIDGVPSIRARIQSVDLVDYRSIDTDTEQPEG